MAFPSVLARLEAGRFCPLVAAAALGSRCYRLESRPVAVAVVVVFWSAARGFGFNARRRKQECTQLPRKWSHLLLSKRATQENGGSKAQIGCLIFVNSLVGRDGLGHAIIPAPKGPPCRRVSARGLGCHEGAVLLPGVALTDRAFSPR
jgi:hypothetical protein